MMTWDKLLNRDRVRQSTLGVDHRADFERDFDRAIFSNPVKRLQDKAQVFPLDPCDAVRTRLTHSLEVSSVARGLGTAIGRWLLDETKIEKGWDRAIEAICATCGLIHDLGNPPFGHAGEDAIRDWFARSPGREVLQTFEDDQFRQDFLKFEGNAQSLRLVSRLQILADFHGLNLTFGTLSASCKYTASSHESDKNHSDHSKSKPGYFASENELVQKIREVTGTGYARNPLTFLVEAADDIVYSVADIEDGVKKGILRWEDVKKEIKTLDHDIVRETIDLQERILKAGGDVLPDWLSDDAYASAFRTAVIGLMAKHVIETFKSNYEKIMQGTYTGELVKDCTGASLVEHLKLIGRTQVYCTPSTLKLELMGRQVIGDLMSVFWEAALEMPAEGSPKTKTFAGKAGALLSDNYRRVFQESLKKTKCPDTYHRLQLVTDYICGMTDSFAKRLHAELKNGV